MSEERSLSLGPIVTAIQWLAVVRAMVASMSLQHIRVQRVHIKLQDVVAMSFSLLRGSENRFVGWADSSALSLDAVEYVL